MPHSWRSRLSKFRRRISRNESVVRWLGLSRAEGIQQQPGLILVQIDGLSRHQFERALKKRRMPFLRKLARKRNYRIHSLYSGLPSSTPAVQGELFYGVRCAVPAFSFRDHESGQIVRMFDAAPARSVQEKLASLGPGLLEGGSAYSNIYSGGAAVSHFCAATMGWNNVASVIKPWVLASIIFWHAWSILRTLTLVLVELWLVLWDFMRGETARTTLWNEFKFIFLRVGVCVVMRELITVGASVDATRGLSVIHLNYLGYDEQAHHRGPSSHFAHWSLKGIDDAIKRVWNAARRSQHRKYTLWVYSDHGQERTIPYLHKFGRPIQQAIADIFGEDVIAHPAGRVPASSGVQHGRAQWVGGRAGERITHHQRGSEGAHHVADSGLRTAPVVDVVSLGPIGHVYPREALSAERMDEIAREMVHKAGVSMVLAPTAAGEARAWTRSGTFQLPAQAAAVFGINHPFLVDVTRDMIDLCHHPHSGAFILGGWSLEGPALTFALENGSHCGPGIEETRAFVFVPADAPVPEKEQGYLRPLDLRLAALRQMGRTCVIDSQTGNCQASEAEAPADLALTTGSEG